MTILPFAFALLPVLAFSQGPDWSWASVGGGNGYEEVYDIATDAQGNVFAVGYSESTQLTFGAVSVSGPGAGNKMAYVVKMDAAGTPLWVRTIDGTGAEVAGAVAVDQDGNCLVAGTFSSPLLTIGDTTLDNASLAPYNDAFLVKYGADGDLLWTRQMSGFTGERVWDLATDPDGSIYAVGQITSAITSFGGTAMDAGPYGNIYYLKMDGDGNNLWIQMTGGADGVADGDIARHVAWVDGQLYLAGGIEGAEANIGPITLGSGPSGSTDVWVAKADPSTGIPTWAERFGSPGGDAVYGLAVDAGGNIHVAGYSGSQNFAVDGDTLVTTGTSEYGFVVQFDPAGEHTWSIGTTGTAFERIFGVTSLWGGGCAITGQFVSPTMGIGSIDVPNTGSSTTFVAGIDANGIVQWVNATDGSTTDQVAGISTDVFGDVVIGGFYTSSPFGLGDILLDNPNAPTLEALVAKLGTSTGLTGTASVPEPLLVFPDPVIDGFMIQGINVPGHTVQVLDVAGRVVHQQRCDANEVVDARGLPAGGYQVRLLDASGSRLAVGRFIKE